MLNMPSDDKATSKTEPEPEQPNKQNWIAKLLPLLDFVEWDRFIVGRIEGYQHTDVYGWIDRDDDYKDFVWARFWPTQEAVEYTTSSDEHSDDIQRIWFGEDNLDDHNPCQRVEDVFDIDNAVELDES